MASQGVRTDSGRDRQKALKQRVLNFGNVGYAGRRDILRKLFDTGTGIRLQHRNPMVAVELGWNLNDSEKNYIRKMYDESASRRRADFRALQKSRGETSLLIIDFWEEESLRRLATSARQVVLRAVQEPA